MQIKDLQERIEGRRESLHDKDTAPFGDHASLAEILLDRLKGSRPEPPVFCEDSFWQYDHKVGIWKELSDGDVRAAIIHMRRSVLWEVPEGSKISDQIKITNSLVGSVLELAKTLAHAPEFFEDAEIGLTFTNGFAVVTDSGEVRLRAHRAEDRSRFAYDFDYDPSAKHEKWDAFLGELFDCDSDRDEKVGLLRDFMGAALTGQSTQYSRALLLLGAGSNGKSVFCDAVAELFPEGSVVQVAPHAMSEPFSAVHLAGAKLNLVTDIPTRELKDAGVFKQVTSGDPISARHLRKDFFSFRPVCGHIFSANDLPQLYDHSHGFFRRWVLVRFSQTFGDGTKGTTRGMPKEQLLSGLFAERAGIMAWALRGASEVRKRGRYTLPESHEKEIMNWRLQVDQVAAFVNERCVDLGGDWERGGTISSSIYDSYRRWAERNGHARMSQAKFSKRLVSLGVPRQRKSSGTFFNLNVLGDLAAGNDEVSEDPYDD